MGGAKVFGIGGALILVATAALHLSGYGELADQLDATSLPDFWSAAMKATWVFFGVQLVVIAAVVAAQFVQRTTANRAVLVICVALLMTNVIILAVWLGVFIGTVAVGVATLSIGTATALLGRAA